MGVPASRGVLGRGSVAQGRVSAVVIDIPTLGAGIMMGGPKPTTRMVLGPGTQPFSPRGIQILRRGRHRRVSLGGAVLPGNPAGEPFTESQHSLELVHGSPPAFRA